MDYDTWFALLRGQLDAVMAGNTSEAKFLDVVKELAQKPDLVLVAGRNGISHQDTILCLILAGALSTGEIEEVASLLASYCCNESTGFNLGIIEAVTGRDDLGPAFTEL